MDLQKKRDELQAQIQVNAHESIGKFVLMIVGIWLIL
jgi:hypothetical protein